MNKNKTSFEDIDKVLQEVVAVSSSMLANSPEQTDTVSFGYKEKATRQEQSAPGVDIGSSDILCGFLGKYFHSGDELFYFIGGSVA